MSTFLDHIFSNFFPQSPPAAAAKGAAAGAALAATATAALAPAQSAVSMARYEFLNVAQQMCRAEHKNQQRERFRASNGH